MTRVLTARVLIVGVLTLFPAAAIAQTLAPARGLAGVTAAAGVNLQQGPAAGAQEAVRDVVKKFHIGVDGGIALDPELITFGAYGEFGPIFSKDVTFRPGVYLSFGEITTEFGIDLDVTYALPGSENSKWRPYVGAGPNFALSHRGIDAEIEVDDSDTNDSTDGTTDTPSRFDFSDTDFDAGFNFIAGARRSNGVFFELKATAYGVANVRLLAGFRF